MYTVEAISPGMSTLLGDEKTVDLGHAILASARAKRNTAWVKLLYARGSMRSAASKKRKAEKHLEDVERSNEPQIDILRKKHLASKEKSGKYPTMPNQAHILLSRVQNARGRLNACEARYDKAAATLIEAEAYFEKAHADFCQAVVITAEIPPEFWPLARIEVSDSSDSVDVFFGDDSRSGGHYVVFSNGAVDKRHEAMPALC